MFTCYKILNRKFWPKTMHNPCNFKIATLNYIIAFHFSHLTIKVTSDDDENSHQR